MKIKKAVLGQGGRFNAVMKSAQESGMKKPRSMTAAISVKKSGKKVKKY